MTFAPAGGLGAAVDALAKWMPMGVTSVHYLLFLPLAVAVYFLMPSVLRRPWLLLASYYFYFFAAPRYLPVLLLGTLLSWLLGLLIARGAEGRRGRRLFLGVALLVLFLAFFKYNGFFAAWLTPLFARFGIAYEQDLFTTASAIGISYYTLTAIGYLVDTARGDVPAERNLLNYALFLGFFPSVTMGPICRAGGLLPQLRDDTRRFDPAHAAGALVDMGVGFFKKLAVADTLAVFVNTVYGDLPAYGGATLTLAAVAFALQLYFDFSGYTDIVRASAGLLGITLPENFKNPYFSTNFSGFWARWHMSFSSWLQDYIFTPLVWSRWTEKLPFVGKRLTEPPVLSSLVVVFLVSGLWHGDTAPFLVWGALMAAYRIGEELLHRRLGKPKKRPPLRVRVGKTAVVLALWVESLVFFRVGLQKGGTVAGALSALGRQFVPVGPARVWQDIFGAAFDGFYSDDRIALCFILFSAVCLAVALWADWAQCFKLKSAPLGTGIRALGPAPRRAVYLGLVLCCFAGFIAGSGGFGGASFLYGGF